MRFALALIGFFPILAACGAGPEGSQSTATTPPAVATQNATPTPSPTPECDEKCQILRTTTPLPTTPPFPPPVVYPAGTRTGVSEIDDIIAAIESKDATRLAGLISLTTRPCVFLTNRQPEPLLCREGVPEGTPKTGIWVSHVEGGLWETTAFEAAERILADATARNWGLHSVYSYRLAGTRAEWMPETDYFITFGLPHPQVGAEFDNLRIIDGKVVALHFAFPEPNPLWEVPADPGWLLPRAK